MSCVVLIFSKDRALQLDATLRSLFVHCSDIIKSQIYVLFITSAASHENQYSLLKNYSYPCSHINFIRERDFRSDVIALLAPYDYVLFLVDDNIFVGAFSLAEVIKALEVHPDTIGFSLRLGENTTYCYSLDKEQHLPDLQPVEKGALKYNWTRAEYDFGYPLEVSSSVYRTTDIIPFIASLSFSNPNTLESAMAANKAQFEKKNPFLMCYKSSVTFCTPLNKTQTVFVTNRAGNNVLYSIEGLSELFRHGRRIDVDVYRNFIPNACHQEVNLELIDLCSSALSCKSEPKFSVIMANYNQGGLIGQAIQSVLAQTFKNWELVIVDDCSTDNSVSTIKEFLSDGRIRLIEHQKNQGYVEALKTGIKNIRSELFGLLDSDDLLEPDAVETIYNAHIQSPDSGMVYSQFMYCDENMKPVNPGYCKQIPRDRTNLEVNTVSHFKTFKLKFYNQTAGFDEDFFCAEDKDISYKMEEVSKLTFVDKVLYRYRKLPHSQSHNVEKRKKGDLNMERARVAALERRSEKNRRQQEGALTHFQRGHEFLNKGDFQSAEEEIKLYRQAINYDLFPRVDNRPLLNPDLSTVVVAYNTNNLLLDCVNSLRSQSYQNYEIIIVDNGGNDLIIADLISLPILYIKCPMNFVLSEGRNIGAHFAKADIIASLDDDATVPNNYVESIIQAFNTYDIIGFRGKVLAKNTEKYTKLPETYDLGEIPIPTTIVAEGNSAFLRDKFQELNGMNPLLFGGEGLELSFRILSGYGENRTIYWPETIIFHDPADTGKQ
jgi:glycosyltransferase involved in cell wall biosynthesis